MASLKPFTLYGDGGINPTKVLIVLIALSLPYTVEHIPLATIKDEYYTSINPNGRLPSLHDPNTDLTLFESNAIIEYLVERYDPEHLISFPQGSKEAALARQWSYFQASGQGPYFGQLSWFTHFAPEKNPSAVERYLKELKRVNGVLESVLKQRKKDGQDWLVGGRCSYADLVFTTWEKITQRVISKEQYNPDEFPELQAWYARSEAREDVKKAFATFKKLE